MVISFRVSSPEMKYTKHICLITSCNYVYMQTFGLNLPQFLDFHLKEFCLYSNTAQMIGILFSNKSVSRDLIYVQECMKIFHQSLWVAECSTFFFSLSCFGHHHLKTKFWQLVPFSPPVCLQISLSVPLFSLLLHSPFPWDKDHSSFQSRTAYTKKTWVMLGDSKTTSNLSRWSLPCLMREGVLTSAQGSFLFFPIQLGPLLQPHFLCGQENMKGTWKANATRLLQLQQSECINDQQMSHKVTELPTGLRSGAERTEQVADIWDSGCFGNKTLPK